MKTISVIIPTFQDPKGIKRCLESLAEQTYPIRSYEVIVVDNGSVPPIEINEAYPFEITLIRCEKPGSYAARNAGVRTSRGQVLAFTDADCVAHPNWLENGLKVMFSRSHCVIVGGEVHLCMPERPTTVALYQSMVGFQQRDNIESRGFSATANLLCERRIFDAIGPFNERLLSGGDREWCWRANAQGVGTVFAPDAVVKTLTRSTLQGAIRQARRVAAGRLYLAKTGDMPIPAMGLEPHRGAWRSAAWILGNPDLPLLNRARILGVACLIKAIATLESIRVRFGGHAERR